MGFIIAKPRRPGNEDPTVLWQAAAAWSQELRQLPWALPVPLRVHGHDSRADIEAAFAVLRDDAPWIRREGVLWHEPSRTDLLFITLRQPARRPACRRH